MKNKVTLRFLLFLWVVLLSVPLHAEYFKHIGLSEGLAQPSVMAIYQDRLGRMWFGTREGISMYDGNRVKAFKGWIRSVTADGGEPSASSVWLGNMVSFIAGDRRDNIYFLIDDDLINYNIRTEKFVRLSDDNGVHALASFGEEVWYVRQDSLFVLKGGSSTPLPVQKTGIASRCCCLTVTEGYIYVGTYDGVFRIDRTSQQTVHLLEGTEIYRIFESSQKEIWIGTRMSGLYRMDGQGCLSKVPYLPGSPEGIGSEQIREFVEDNEGDIWFGTFDGLYRYHAAGGHYSLIQIPRYAGGLHHPSIFALYKDVAGTLWVGSYYGGVNYFNPQYDSFVHYDYERNSDSYYSYIGEMAIDRHHHLWLGTDGGGICCVDKKWNILHQFTAGSGNTIPHNNIKSICYDEKNNSLYIATYLGGLSRYDIDNGRFFNYWKAGSASADAPNNIVFHVRLWNGQLYISATNGFFRLDTQTQQFHPLPLPADRYLHFDIDPAGNICLAGQKNVIYTHVDRPQTVVRLPLTESGESKKASPTRVLATSGGVYIGTLGGGVLYYDTQTRQTTHYTFENGQLPDNYCYNLCRTQRGNILITSSKGVTCLTPAGARLTTIDLMSTFPSAHIIEGCGLLSSGGSIYVGDTKGVTVFSEDEFGREDESAAPACFYFSELWVNNEMITPADGTGILSQSLPCTQALRLRPGQNNLIIHFALSDYSQQLSEKWFRYKLEGLDKDWVKTKQRKLYYTNLGPGTYTLHVASADEKSGRILKTISLRLDVASPWYGTWWAWTIYVVAFISFVSYYVYSRIAKRTLALSLEKERFEKQQAEQLNHEKLVFFTNVSHEFRTPLTLIISQIDILLQRYSISTSVYAHVVKMKKNALKMNELISELLEFRKLEQNYGTIRIREQDIVSLLKEVYLSFADYAGQRKITYEFALEESRPVLCWFEAQLIEKVFFNLLSNAFKYTPDKGRIVLSGEVTDEEVTVRITDTGIGISEHDRDQIFARFFQAGNREKGNLFSGTGIGLALTRTIVEKHHGEISVESVVGEGSTFSVRLPRRKEVYAGDKNVEFDTRPAVSDILPDSLPLFEESVPLPDEGEASPDEEGETKPGTVLLVDDNEELLQLLKGLFEPFYRILCARNGKEALECVYESLPDLVISDVMMPEMTGTELCQQIKNNIDLCHIPVILLTALCTAEQNIDGLNRGADDYVTKPFHAQLLLTRANNLLRNRRLLQYQFNKKPISDIDLTGISINPLDKEFMKRALEVIENNIDNVELDIPLMCKEMGVGRTLIFNKFKAMTGMSPNRFLLTHRLKYAADLLKQHPDYSVATVSERSGFNTPVYFSRCFKNQFGCTPQSYKRQTE